MPLRGKAIMIVWHDIRAEGESDDHLSDATRASWKHDRAGLGRVRFDRVRAALEEIDFGGVAIIEVISPRHAGGHEIHDRGLGI